MDSLLLTLLSVALLLAPGQPRTTSAAGTGPFAALSPANQKVAQALHDAQRPPVAFSRDEIAAMKRDGDGWGVILMRMQARGQLAGARSVGHVVSGRYRPPAPGPIAAARAARPDPRP
jgi:hypothetical protein